MASKKFTEDERNQLKASLYVLDASPNTVHFSIEFKEKFWKLICEGNTPRATVIELGIDPDILGKSRVNGLYHMIRKEFHSGKGFRDIATQATFYGKHINPEVKVKHLEQQLAYKDQEIEFLKKIVSLGKGAPES